MGTAIVIRSPFGSTCMRALRGSPEPWGLVLVLQTLATSRRRQAKAPANNTTSRQNTDIATTPPVGLDGGNAGLFPRYVSMARSSVGLESGREQARNFARQSAYLQFSTGWTMESITRISMEPFCGSSRSPRSRMAVKSSGPMGVQLAPLAGTLA